MLADPAVAALEISVHKLLKLEYIYYMTGQIFLIKNTTAALC